MTRLISTRLITTQRLENSPRSGVGTSKGVRAVRPDSRWLKGTNFKQQYARRDDVWRSKKHGSSRTVTTCALDLSSIKRVPSVLPVVVDVRSHYEGVKHLPPLCSVAATAACVGALAPLSVVVDGLLDKGRVEDLTNYTTRDGTRAYVARPNSCTAANPSPVV
eukprot:8495453-Pyramimonas_sp.AAC.1